MTKKSKKDRIIELMDKGKSAKEIANMLNTSESYINKVKSISRTELSKLSDSKSEEMSIPTNFDVEGTNKQRKVRSGNFHLSLTSKMRKSFYRWLDAGKHPADFIKRTGVDGRVLEEEYETYLKWKDADQFELQKKLLALVQNDTNETGSFIAGKAIELLSNSSLIELLKKGIEEIKRKFAEKLMAERMETKKYTLPSMYKRPKCRNCGNELMGVVIDHLYVKDLHLLRHMNSVCLCANCRKSMEIDDHSLELELGA